VKGLPVMGLSNRGYFVITPIFIQAAPVISLRPRL
jgi:hypothetical protein